MSAKAVKTIILRLPGLIGFRHLPSITRLSSASLASRLASTWRAAASRVASRLRSSIEVLLPADEIDILQQHLHLAAHQQALEGGILDVDILNIDLFQIFGLGLDTREHGLYIAELALDRECEGRHSAFHALQDVHAQRWIRLSSRSACRKKPVPPLTSVLYFVS